MITENDVDELLKKYTKKEYSDVLLSETELLDYRSKVIVSHLRIEQLMDCIIIKKLKNHKDLVDPKFFKKQKILFESEIINKDLNHELKILNKIRNVFAHEIDPIRGKTTNIIKQFKFYPKNKTNKEADLVRNAMTDGGIAGIITGLVIRYLVEILWEIQPNDKKK